MHCALWVRRGQELAGLIHHSDRGVQYVAIRYSERLAEAGAVASVGSRGDSYDNALAESLGGLYKAELIRHRGPWRGLEDVEFATLEYIDWFNHRRLHGELDMVPPAEFEATYFTTMEPAKLAAAGKFNYLFDSALAGAMGRRFGILGWCFKMSHQKLCFAVQPCGHL